MFLRGVAVAVRVVECKFVAEYLLSASAAEMYIHKDFFCFVFLFQLSKRELLNNHGVLKVIDHVEV